jgi:hypothetical protein
MKMECATNAECVSTNAEIVLAGAANRQANVQPAASARPYTIRRDIIIPPEITDKKERSRIYQREYSRLRRQEPEVREKCRESNRKASRTYYAKVRRADLEKSQTPT